MDEKIPTFPTLGKIEDFPINPQLLYFAGAMRDGTLPLPYDAHYEISVGQKNKDWLEKIIRPIMVETLGIKEAKIRLKIDKNTPRLVVYSKDVFGRLARVLTHPTGSSCWKTPPICRSHPELQKWYLRGFFDAEGEVPHVEGFLDGTFSTKPRLRIRIHQAWNKKNGCPVLEDLAQMCSNFGIKIVGIYGPKRNVNTFDFDLAISGRDALLQFYRQIGTSHPDKKKRFSLLFNLYGIRP